MKTISLKLPEYLDAELTAAARERSRSKSLIVREALEMYLSNGGRREKSFGELAREYRGMFVGPEDLSSNPDHMTGYGQ